MMKEYLRHTASLILPVTVTLIVPWLIEPDLMVEGNFWAVSGLFIVLVGLMVIILTIRMFIQIGKGTLAPWDPTRKLVVGGLYSYVRNPMILGVWIVLIGESILFFSLNIAIWAALFFLINTIYFILSEEPGLERRFGEEYLEYKKHVPRWIPRRTPWRRDPSVNAVPPPTK